MPLALNLTFAEWAAVFGDAKLTTGLLDRVTHHCPIVGTGNESFRFRHSSATAKAKIKSHEHTRKPGGESSSTNDINDPF